VLISRIFRKYCILKAENIGEMSGEFFYRGLEQIGISKNFFLFKIFLRFRNKLIKKANAFISLSSEITSEFKKYGIGVEKIYEIPNPVDQDIFCKVHDEEKKKIKAKLNFPINKKILIYTGRLVYEKGLPFLLKVWNEIQKNNDDLFLVLVGSGGDFAYSCEKEIKEYVKENQLENGVIFTGKVDVKRIHEYLKSADIFIFPTERGEGLPNSVLEAMACGLVIVTNPVSGISDVVKDKVNGFLMEKGNVEQYCNYINMLNKDEHLLNEISRNAVLTISEKYSKAIVVQSYIDLFNKF
ncbi:MAG: glycosyltransferase family 4 protein, partial [Ignavibacteriaceae bacterium]